MNASPDMLTTALKMFAALAAVLGAMFVVYYFTRRLSKFDRYGSKDKLVRVVANKFIGVKKNICLVEIPGSVLVLGVTNDRITLLSQISDEATLEKIRCTQAAPPPISFADQLNKFTAKFKTLKDE
jgi:flagellar biosynthetic protein FliO